MLPDKEQFIAELITDTVSEMQDVLSLRINEKEREIEAVEQEDQELAEELSFRVGQLAEESKVLGEIRDDNPQNPRHTGIRRVIRQAIDLHELAHNREAALKNAEEELTTGAGAFLSELEQLDEDAELENGHEGHTLNIILQAKTDILTACIEKLREKEFKQALEQSQAPNVASFSR